MEMATQVMDRARVEEFGERIVDVMNGAALALMMSVGHRTELFDAMDGLPPATSEGVAAAAGLDERYVREWLGAMVTGGVVEYAPETGTYRLPPEHAACLTRRARADNLAVLTQYIPVLANVEDRIVECFREGGGVDYSEYHRFHEVMAEDSGQSVLSSLEESILPLVPGLVARLEEGIDVLDVGCGSGRAMNLLARRYPRSRFTGYDFSEEAIGVARAEAERHGTANVTFEVRDVTRLPEGKFDLVCAFDAIHDQRDPDAVLRSIHAALRPGGHFLMQDIHGSSHVEKNVEHPIGTLLYTISTMHCMTVSLAQGGAGLGTMWGKETALQMLAEAGFGKVMVNELAHDIQNLYYVCDR